MTSTANDAKYRRNTRVGNWSIVLGIAGLLGLFGLSLWLEAQDLARIGYSKSEYRDAERYHWLCVTRNLRPLQAMVTVKDGTEYAVLCPDPATWNNFERYPE